MDKTILIVSDLHLGAGETLAGEENPLEDFHSDEKFAKFLEWKTSQRQGPLELLIMGDAFDFPQVLPDIGKACEDPALGTTENESLSRFELIIQGHDTFFKALREFLSAGHIVRVLRGNHDIDLIWPSVRNKLRNEIGGGDNLIIEDDYIFRFNGLYCEHGNQYSAENAFSNPANPVKEDSNGTRRLERCWGTYFMDVLYNDIETRFPIIDNIAGDQMIQGCLMAIKSAKVHFTGKMIGRMLKIARKAGLPITGWIGSLIMGEKSFELPPGVELENIQISTVEDLLKNLRDREISEELLKRYKDEPDFKEQLDAELHEMVQHQASKEVSFLPYKDINLTMSWITGKNSYERAAEKIIQEKPGVRVVIFGHTHSPVDGNYEPISDKGKYFNSGSWTSGIDLYDSRNQGKSFDELCESGIRKNKNDFVEVTLTQDGNVYAELGSC